MKTIILLILSLSLWAKEPAMPTQIATLGGGCFWCLEAVYEETNGVTDVVSGYMGDEANLADYATVSSGKTNHAEVVQIHFDPSIVSYEKLLDIFWNIHDPTSLNRQGADIGPQYRSVIFVHNKTQEEIAKASLHKAQKSFSKPIVTQIVPAMEFYKAEDYHQDYYANNPNQAYCQVVIAPKLKKFKKSGLGN
jgi:peptide-methionine (S)-S-oxide reductase